MKFDDLKKLYLDIRRTKGKEAYKNISELFHNAKIKHKKRLGEKSNT